MTKKQRCPQMLMTSCAADIMKRWGGFLILTGYKSTLIWEIKLCVTKSHFLCYWLQLPKATYLLRASLIVSVIHGWGVDSGPICSFTVLHKDVLLKAEIFSSLKVEDKQSTLRIFFEHKNVILPSQLNQCKSRSKLSE